MIQQLRVCLDSFIEGFRGAKLTARIAKEVMDSCVEKDTYRVPDSKAVMIMSYCINHRTNKFFREGAEIYFGLHPGGEVSIKEVLDQIYMKKRNLPF